MLCWLKLGIKKFAIIVDEARDASLKEKMAVILRYILIVICYICFLSYGTNITLLFSCRFVNDEGHVIERFLGVQHVTDTTSSSLKEALDAMLSKHNLSIKQVRGQGYDGASNMRGEYHGLQRLVMNDNPYAFYVHYFSHQLQLVVVSVAKCCKFVTDFFDYISLIVNTVNTSCKRHDQLAQHHHDNLVKSLEAGDIFSGRGKN